MSIRTLSLSEFQLPSGTQRSHPHPRWGSVWKIPHPRQAAEHHSYPRWPHRPCGRVPVQDLWEVSCSGGGRGRSGNESKCGLKSRLSATRLINPSGSHDLLLQQWGDQNYPIPFFFFILTSCSLVLSK